MQKIRELFLVAYKRFTKRHNLDAKDFDNTLKDFDEIVMMMWPHFTLIEQEQYLLRYANIYTAFIPRLDIIEEEFKIWLEKFLKNNREDLKKLILQEVK